MAVLLTGANGFLGNYLSNTLTGKDLTTLGLSGCDYNVDLAKTIPNFIEPFKKVVHTAGLAHIFPKSKQSEQRFFDVNVTGTSNLLKGLGLLTKFPEIFVFISTVAVYGVDIGDNIDESTPLNGTSPYALSKIRTEEMIHEWGAKNNVRALILRLPLIVGKNPPGNLGAMIRAIRRGYYFRIGDGSARRSMVLAEDIARFVATCPPVTGIYNLTDGFHPTVKQLDEIIAAQSGDKIKTISYKTAKIIAVIGDRIPYFPFNKSTLSKLTSSLTFSDVKARKEIGWSSRSVIENPELF